MTKPMKDVTQIPVSSCPLCSEHNIKIVEGSKKFLIGKNPDSVRCPDCGAIFLLSQDGMSIHYDVTPSPYVFFGDYYSGWIDPSEASRLAGYIRGNSTEALAYLSGSKKHAWNIRIILDATGSADADSIHLSFEWEDEPTSREEAKRELTRIRQIQKEIRHVKREMAQEMKEIRAHYGRRKENQSAKAAALHPYEQVGLTVDEILIKLDRGKLDIQNWVEEHK